MTTITAPNTHAQTYGDLGYAYQFARLGLLAELAESWNPAAEGLVPLYGELSGSGSDIVRIARVGGVGYAERFASMASETDAIVASGFTSGYDSVSLGRYGLAKEGSFKQRLLARPDTGVTLQMLLEKVPASWVKTIRYLVCVAGSGISTSTGSTSTAWSFDNELNLIRAFKETEGFEGLLYTIRHPEQFTDLAESIRSEPSLQFPEVLAAIQGLTPGGGAFNFLGANNRASFDVQASGGAHQGFAFAPGAIGHVVAQTNPLADELANPAEALYVPEMGLVITRDTDGSQATNRFDANLFIGVGLANSALFPQRRIVSVND